MDRHAPFTSIASAILACAILPTIALAQDLQTDFAHDLQNALMVRQTREKPPLTAITKPHKATPIQKTRPKKAETLGYRLSFPRSGIISDILVESGSKVRAGDTLAKQNSAEAAAKVRQAEAALTYQKLKLDEFYAATSSFAALYPSVADTLKLQNALAGLEDARRSALSIAIDGYIKSDDAIHNRADQFFQNAKTSAPSLIFVNIDGGVQNAISPQRVSIENLLATWKSGIDTATTADASTISGTSIDALTQIKNFLNTLSYIINGVSSDTNISQYNLHLWKGDLYIGRNNVDTAIKDIISARGKIRDAQLQVDLQNTALVPSKSQVVPTQKIAQQAALVSQAEAALDLARTQLEQTALRAPSDGAVTKILLFPGSVVAAGTPVLYFKPVVHITSVHAQTK